MQKTKRRTLVLAAVWVLSLLLIGAIALSVTGAYFQANKTAKATLTFGDGITLVVNNVKLADGISDDTAANTNDLYLLGQDTLLNEAADVVLNEFEITPGMTIDVQNPTITVAGQYSFIAIKVTFGATAPEANIGEDKEFASQEALDGMFILPAWNTDAWTKVEGQDIYYARVNIGASPALFTANPTFVVNGAFTNAQVDAVTDVSYTLNIQAIQNTAVGVGAESTRAVALFA